jgi:short-subunit dehydrogenase
MPGGKQTAEEVARIGIDALARGRRTIVPYFAGRLTAQLVRILPVGLITHLIEKKARPKAS